ncbi:MAG: hypothetical protein P8012_15980 [Desulfobacterales bacterium]
MQTNKVIVRFKDGTLVKGNTSDFFPNKVRFHIHRLDGQTEERYHSRGRTQDHS